MRKQHWPKRDPIKNYFPLPNEIFSLGPVSYTHLDVYKRQILKSTFSAEAVS